MSKRGQKEKLMRTFLVLMCSLALALVATAAQEKKKEQKAAPKKPAQTTQVAKPKGGVLKQADRISKPMPHNQVLRQRRVKESIRTKQILPQDNR